MYELHKIEWSQNVLFAASYKDDAENVEYVCKGLKGLKFAVVCYFRCRMFNPTNLLNYVVPSIELILQM